MTAFELAAIAGACLLAARADAQTLTEDNVDSIRILEAVYAPAPTEQSWLTGIGEYFQPFTPGLGALVTSWDLGAPVPVLHRAVTVGMGDDLASLFRNMYGLLARERAQILPALLAPHPSVVGWTRSS